MHTIIRVQQDNPLVHVDLDDLCPNCGQALFQVVYILDDYDEPRAYCSRRCAIEARSCLTED